jgi:tetratricopeptide (TPR) repeat protein
VRTNRIICLGLFLLALWAYLPALQHDFVVLDDENYVRANPHVQQGLTMESVRWAFTTGRQGNWHPVTWLSHMLDCQLFGLNPRGHHLVNVLFHAVNTALVFLLLRIMTGAVGRSLAVALLFGLHPIHVESVAWVAERKDVLSTFFGLLTLLAYAKAVTSDKWQVAGTETIVPAPAGSRFTVHGSHFYWLALFFFALGLMSKPMLVTLPFVLLLLDYWPLDRWKLRSFWSLVIEKAPFFALAAASSVVTFLVQRSGGAMRAMAGVPLIDRGENALVSYARYLGKLFYPVNLTFYPDHGGWKLSVVLLAGLLLLGISVLVFQGRQRQPYLLVGWLWLVGTLIPVIGLVQVGEQAMADRYTYLPSIGLFIMVVWGVQEWTRRWRHQAVTLGVVAVMVMLSCFALTRRQLSYWQNSETLFRHAIAVAEDNYAAHQYLGFVLKQQWRFDEAIPQFETVLRYAPDSIPAHTCLGDSLVLSGHMDEGVKELETAIRLDRSVPPRSTASRPIPVEVEVNAGYGDTLVVIVGLPDAAVKESRDRVSTALTNSGYKFPMGRTTINLAPADVKKEGPSFDLPIAIGMLAASEQIETDQLDNFVVVGELALDRRGAAVQRRFADRPARAADGKTGVLVPAENAAEAAVVAGLQVIPVQNLREAAQFLEGEIKIAPAKVDIAKIFDQPHDDDWISPRSKARNREARAWKSPRRAATMSCSSARPAPANPCWPNGSRRFLPPLTLDEALETTKIHSIVGLLKPGQALVTRGRSARRITRRATPACSAATSIRRRAKFRSRTTAFCFWTNCRSSSAACWRRCASRSKKAASRFRARRAR